MPRAPQRSRGTGPRATGKRSVNRRARACPSPCNDRGGNPLGCACGIRGPPRYGKKTGSFAGDRPPRYGKKRDPSRETGPRATEKMLVLKTRATYPCLQCRFQLLDGGFPQRFIAAVEFILAQHLPRVFFAGGRKRPAFFHSTRADIIGSECQLPISIVFV